MRLSRYELSYKQNKEKSTELTGEVVGSIHKVHQSTRRSNEKFLRVQPNFNFDEPKSFQPNFVIGRATILTKNESYRARNLAIALVK